MNSANSKTVTIEIITAVCALIQAKVTSEYARMFPRLSAPVISFEIGRSYARIIKNDECGGRSCYGFVDLSNGNLLKSASWKGPAKNFARGNIFDADPTRSCGFSGIG